MAFRTLEITKPSELHVQEGQLTIEQEERVVRVPLEDIHNIICIGANIRISTMVLSKLTEREIAVLMLDEKYRASGIVIPVNANARQAEVMNKQIEFDDLYKAEIWHEIIQTKILNQSRALTILGLKGADEVMKIALEMELNDENCAEAYAAKIYFQYLHPGLNRRVEEPLNSHMNYGYAVLRNTIIRELIATGLQPALGLHHCNQFNAFNLADDLIEPWRPMVDLIAYHNVDSNIILTKKQRFALAHVVHNACRMNDKRMNVLSGIELMVDSYRKTVIEKENHLVLPTIMPIESMELLNE